MKFKLKADATLEADDIYDAMVQIAFHYLHLAMGKDSTLWLDGLLSIRPVNAEDEQQ